MPPAQAAAGPVWPSATSSDRRPSDACPTCANLIKTSIHGRRERREGVRRDLRLRRRRGDKCLPSDNRVSAGNVGPAMLQEIPMRAAYYEANGAAAQVLRLAEVATPEPGPGEVRVRLA